MNQVEWEQECLERSRLKYYATQDKLREKGQLTDAAKYVLQDRLEEAADKLRASANEDLGSSYWKLRRIQEHIKVVAEDDTNYEKVIFIALRTILSELALGKTVGVTKLLIRIGSRIEAETKCMIFENANPAYFGVVMESFKEQQVTQTEHMQRVLMKKFSDFELEWNDWGQTVKLKVGAHILNIILQVMDDLLFVYKMKARKRHKFVLETTVAFDEWMGEFERAKGLLQPIRAPLKSPPVEWTDPTMRGGYYTSALAVPFVKSKYKAATKFIQKHNPVQHMEAINKIQATKWKINKRVFKVQEEIFRRNLKIGIPDTQPIKIPDFPSHLDDKPKELYTEMDKEEVLTWKALAKRAYRKEQQRKGKVIAFRQCYLLAKELEDWDEFYYVYNCDFRGRIYCATSGLSPQGADSAKGLLQFGEGVTLGVEGIRFLAIHGANTFGEDKLAYQGRVSWIREQEPLISAIVADPIANDMWKDADKPYQFLAFCYEWADCDYGRNLTQ